MINEHSINAPDIESSTPLYSLRFYGKIGDWLLSKQKRATKNAIQSQFGEKRGLSVLDVGGGHGQNIELMVDLGHRLTIAGSPTSSTAVIKKNIDKQIITYIETSLLELPFTDKSFDVVICYRMLTHMQSWDVLCEELQRVSNGLVLVDYPTKKSVNVFSNLMFGLKKHIEKSTRRYRLFSDNEILLQFNKSGWKRSFIRRQFFFPMALHRLMNLRFFSISIETVARLFGLTLLFGSPVISGFVSPDYIDFILQTEASSSKYKDIN